MIRREARVHEHFRVSGQKARVSRFIVRMSAHERATVSILAEVTRTIAAPSDDYREMKRLPVLGVREMKPIVVF